METTYITLMTNNRWSLGGEVSRVKRRCSATREAITDIMPIKCIYLTNNIITVIGKIFTHCTDVIIRDREGITNKDAFEIELRFFDVLTREIEKIRQQLLCSQTISSLPE